MTSMSRGRGWYRPGPRMAGALLAAAALLAGTGALPADRAAAQRGGDGAAVLVRPNGPAGVRPSTGLSATPA